MIGLMTLPRSLAFAVVAGLSAPIFVGLVRPFVGSASALSLFALFVSAVYVFGLAARPSVLWLFGGSPAELAFLCAGLMGVVRSGWLRRDARRQASFARAFSIEVGLIGVGLWLGAWAGQGSFFPIAMGVWSFFLVQAAFCLIGGPAAFEARTVAPTEPDAFEAVARRLRSLLEEDALG